jgi:hypothetical protein
LGQAHSHHPRKNSLQVLGRLNLINFLTEPCVFYVRYVPMYLRSDCNKKLPRVFHHLSWSDR